MNKTLAATLFGPEYDNAQVETIGSYECSTSRGALDIVYRVGPNINMTLLPPGGYVIRYLEGSYLLMQHTPLIFVIGGELGMHVGWKSAAAKDWTSVPFPIAKEIIDPSDLKSIDASAVHNLFYLEFTKPHRLQLVPPKGAGMVKVRIVRYVPSFMSGTDANSLVKSVI